MVAYRLPLKETLFFIFTPLAAVPMLESLHQLDEDGLRTLKRTATPSPPYPEPVREAGHEQQLVIAAVINPEGRFDANRFILLKCQHQLTARVALETLQEWKLESGAPVDVLTLVEVNFFLRAFSN